MGSKTETTTTTTNSNKMPVGEDTSFPAPHFPVSLVIREKQKLCFAVYLPVSIPLMSCFVCKPCVLLVLKALRLAL